MKGWTKIARDQGKLRITENNNCPYCNPMHKTNVPTNLNACEKHLWVSKKWYENYRKAYLP